MISFDVKIVLHVLLESSVTTRFPTTSRPAGVEPDWADNSDLWSMLRNAEARTGHDLFSSLGLAFDFAITFILSKFWEG